MKSKNIIFVHGLFGWGSLELGGLPYWGHALKLDSQGFKLHQASCGPVSSFHDRACEVVPRKLKVLGLIMEKSIVIKKTMRGFLMIILIKGLSKIGQKRTQ